jgi:hypothetical protein
MRLNALTSIFAEELWGGGLGLVYLELVFRLSNHGASIWRVKQRREVHGRLGTPCASVLTNGDIVGAHGRQTPSSTLSPT